MSDEIKTKDETEVFEQDVDLDATFVFPQTITEHVVLGKHLIIAPEYANWLVCDNEEYVAFCLFRDGKSIQEVEELLMEQRRMSHDEARRITSRLIAQILGKEFMRQAVVTEKEVFKTVSLCITAGCNLRCSICWRYLTVAEPNECSYDDWRRFLDAFASIGGQTVTVTGGEPMTSLDCLKIVQYAKKLGFKVILLTNGTLINEENARILSEYCGEIQVSIDGPDAQTHDSVRGKGTFERTIAGLRILAAFPGYHLSVAMTPTADTLPAFRSKLHGFREWIWQNIDKDISLRITMNLWPGRNIPLMTDEELAAHKRNIVAMCNDQLESEYIDKMDAFGVVPNRRVAGCGLAALFTVDYRGDMRTCVYLPDPFGNIKDIGENGDLFRGAVQKVQQIVDLVRVEELLACRECDIRYFCGGKCRADNKKDHGCPKLCVCDHGWKESWYRRLIRINSYVVQPVF